jgi:hypothetical protein
MLKRIGALQDSGAPIPCHLRFCVTSMPQAYSLGSANTVNVPPSEV